MAVCTTHVECTRLRCANNQNGECIALTECLEANGKLCPFYKTKERANAEIIEFINRKASRMRKTTVAVKKGNDCN